MLSLQKTRLLLKTSVKSKIHSVLYDTKFARYTSTNVEGNDGKAKLKVPIGRGSDKFNRSQNYGGLPNILTYSRIAVTPLVGAAIVSGSTNVALGLISYAALTDLLDGFLARKLKQQSHFGAIMDPIADKILLTTCFLCSGYAGIIPGWLVKGFVLKDVSLLIAGGFIRYFGFLEPTKEKFFNFEKHPTFGFQPTILSKVNTALQISLLLTALYTLSMKGDPTYDNLMFAFHMLTAFTTAGSLTQYMIRSNNIAAFARIYKNKQ